MRPMTRDRTAARVDDADTPAQLSAQSWQQLARRAGGHVVDARLPFLSAGVAFFAVLSIAPVLVTALSVSDGCTGTSQRTSP